MGRFEGWKSVSKDRLCFAPCITFSGTSWYTGGVAGANLWRGANPNLQTKKASLSFKLRWLLVYCEFEDKLNFWKVRYPRNDCAIAKPLIE